MAVWSTGWHGRRRLRDGEAQSQVAAVRTGRRDGYKDSLGVRINNLVMEQMTQAEMREGYR